MEKATGVEHAEKGLRDSSMEADEPVKSVAEKEVTVANVEYTDAIKNLSPWVSDTRVPNFHSPLT